MITIFDYLKIKNSDNIKDFIYSIKKHNMNLDVDYHLNSYYVLDRVHNRELRRNLIKRLMDIGYDFKSPFPYESFSDIETLEVIKNNLIKEFDYYMYYIKKGKDFTSKDGLKVIACKTEKELTPFVFRVGYDILINQTKEGRISIILNPKYKKQVSLYNLYNKLIRAEKDSWTIWDKGMVVKTKEGFNSVINIETLVDYIKEFDLKIS